MILEPYEVDSSRMPLRLGSALRVPSYAYPNWGISEGEFREESDRQYEIEWKVGSPQQMQYVVDAVNASGMGNFSQMLREANARVVSRLVRELREGVNYLETGAGVSTLSVYDYLERDGFDLERIYATLIEPSASRLENTAAKLEKKGLKRGKDFRTFAIRDLDIPNYIEPYSQDIISSVATTHHHAYLDTPIEAMKYALGKPGFIILADWHNSMWEHPNRVYEFLEKTFDWETKEEDLKAFEYAYPQSLKPASYVGGPEGEANKMIKRFWKGWAKVRKEALERGDFSEIDELVMLEAHTPVERYIEELNRAGFRFHTDYIKEIMPVNPWPLLPTSSLLYVTVAENIF